MRYRQWCCRIVGFTLLGAGALAGASRDAPPNELRLFYTIDIGASLATCG